MGRVEPSIREFRTWVHRNYRNRGSDAGACSVEQCPGLIDEHLSEPLPPAHTRLIEVASVCNIRARDLAQTVHREREHAIRYCRYKFPARSDQYQSDRIKRHASR